MKLWQITKLTNNSQYLPGISQRHPLFRCLQFLSCHISTVQPVLLEIVNLKFSSALGWVKLSFGQSCTGARIDCPASRNLGPTVPKKMCYCPWVHFLRPRVGRTQLHPPLRWETCSKWFWGFVEKQNRKPALIWSLTIFWTCCSPRFSFFLI